MAFTASDDDDAAYREMTAKLLKRIDEHTLEELKYQCRDKVGPGRLERVTSNQQFFELLEERDEINGDDVEYLENILRNVGRIDLCKLVKAYSELRSRSAQNERALDSPNRQVQTTASTETAHQALPNYHMQQVVLPPGLRKYGFDTQQKGIPVVKDDSKTKNSPKMTVKGANAEENLTIPFDTSGHPLGGFHVQPQPANLPAQRIGYAMPPELLSAVDHVVSSISRGWQIAARRLGVPEVIIDNAQDNWPRNVRNQIDETFRYWARSDREASVAKLISALRHVGRNDIADDLEYGHA